MGAPLAAEALAPVLREYGLALDAAEVPREVTARVLHLPATAGGLALKVFPADQHAEAHTEASLLAYLVDREREREREGRGHGYRVQPLLRTTTGAPLLSLDSLDLLDSLDDRRVLVTRWEPGFHLAYPEIDPPGWQRLGRVLAALHLALDDAPSLPLRSFVADLRARDLDSDRRTLDDHRRRAAASLHPHAPLLQRWLADRTALFDLHAHACQAAAPSTPADRPIHNDYNVHNYLFHAHGDPTILDWERSILAPRELEVCRCLAHLPLVAPTSAWAFVEGYLSLRALDPDLVPWALQACLTLHALKHWPVEPALAGAPGSAERLGGQAEIVRAFVEGRPRLDRFGDALRTRIGAGRSPRSLSRG